MGKVQLISVKLWVVTYVFVGLLCLRLCYTRKTLVKYKHFSMFYKGNYMYNKPKTTLQIDRQG